MGAALMKELDKHAQNLGRAYACTTCSGIMLPSKKTLTRNYGGKKIVIKNFPFLKCNNNLCEEESYDMGQVLKYLTLADTTNNTVFDCDTVSNVEFDFHSFFND